MEVLVGFCYVEVSPKNMNVACDCHGGGVNSWIQTSGSADGLYSRLWIYLVRMHVVVLAFQDHLFYFVTYLMQCFLFSFIFLVCFKHVFFVFSGDYSFSFELWIANIFKQVGGTISCCYVYSSSTCGFIDSFSNFFGKLAICGEVRCWIFLGNLYV